MGKDLTREQADQLVGLGIERLAVTYDGDSAGIAGAVRVKGMLADTDVKVNIWQLPDGLDPDTWFGGKNEPQPTKEPIRIDMIEITDMPKPKTSPKANEYRVSAAALEPLLRYDALSADQLAKRIDDIVTLVRSSEVGDVTVPRNFIDQDVYKLLNGSLILHLRLWMDQQSGKRRPVRTAEQLGEMMGCSDRTIRKYKKQLVEMGYLEVERKGRYRAFYNVRFFPKGYRSALKGVA